MKFFSSHTPWDFPVPHVDPEARLLLSPTTSPPQHRYPFAAPKEVMIDSGAYHHGKRNAKRSRLRTLQEQLQIAGQFAGSKLTLVHCDVMLREGADPRACVDETLRNAEWFMAQEIDSSYGRMTVAQARTPDEMYLVVSQLAEFQPDLIGIGGLANLHRQHRALLGSMVEGAVEGARSLPLHVLGVTASHILTRLKANAITSCDSAAATWSAIYGSLLYSRPYRRYRLIGAQSARPEVRQQTGYYTSVVDPPPCPCPVCRDDPQQLKGNDLRAKHLRCIHNYYHLKLEVEGEGPWQAAYLLAEYQSAIKTSS